MDEADAVDLSKENIQPLKQGRNTAQLGVALQAQTDEQLHQMLRKTQEMYETRIRTYNGPDPLDVWVEYISWVEQSFPKHGLEGNLEILLQKCFFVLKDEERYKQDRRFIKLWIKFIEMQTVNRIEVYRFLSGQGIGTACTDFYCSWAYEFELMNDNKHANAVYQLAYKNMAQPADELELAYTQFQLRVAKAVLADQANATQENLQNTADLENQRTVMASLCPVGPKQNKAANVRVGPNVLSSAPGTLPRPSAFSQAKPSLLGASNTVRERIQIYKEESTDPVHSLGKGQTHVPSVPVHGARNKENTLDAGPWNKPGAVRNKASTIMASYGAQAVGPTFEVHRDEAADVPCSTPSVKTYTPSVLKPRKFEENPMKETLAAYEPSDPSIKVMYPKEKVYAGGREFQLEEVMALEHRIEKAAEKAAKEGQSVDPVEMERLRLEQMKKEIEDRLRAISNGQKVNEEKAREALSSLTEKPPTFNALSLNPPLQNSTAKITATEPADNNTSAASAGSSRNSGTMGSRVESTNDSAAKVMSSLAGSFNTVLTTPGAVPSYTNNCNSNANERSTDKERASASANASTGYQGPGQHSVCNQSLTVHTKLAMNEVDDLWRSPNISKYQTSSVELPEIAPQTPQAPANADNLIFEICKDENAEAIRPPTLAQARLADPGFSLSSRLKKNGPPVLSDHGRGKVLQPLAPQPAQSAPAHGLPRSQADDPDESLAHALGPDVSFGPKGATEGPRSADLRGVLKKRSPTAPPLLASILPVPGSVTAVSADPDKLIQEWINPETAAEPSDVVQGEPLPVQETGCAAFSVFVDDQEPKAPAAPAVEQISVNAKTPVSKLNIVAKEKENARKFCYAELEEIVKKPMMPPPRKSIAPIPKIPAAPAIFPPKDAFTRRAGLPELGEDADQTCNTMAFSGGCMAASTPFTSASWNRDKAGVSRELDGSMFVNPCPDEFMTPIKSVKPMEPMDPMEDVNGASTFPVSKECLMTINRLSVIYESSTGSSRTNSSASAASATATIYSAVTEGDARPALSLVDEEQEDLGSAEACYHDVSVCINGEVDPFDSNLVTSLLAKAGFPHSYHNDGICFSSRNLPTRRNDTLVLEGDTYTNLALLGEGAYAKVWRGMHSSSNRHAALKIQKPSWEWEFYISREIQNRLSNKLLKSSFMHAEKLYVYNNGSVLVTDLIVHGSLLDLANKIMKIGPSRETVTFIIAEQLLRVVEALHECNIIHGDLKPDNVLIRSMPAFHSQVPCLVLIDFGRSIDMRLFPRGTTFQRNVKTEGFSCVEMQTNRPWTYQTDLYGLASCVHCLLTGEYMKVQETNGCWNVRSALPRFADKERWKRFFGSLLNVASCAKIPSLQAIREDLFKGVSLNEEDFTILPSLLNSLRVFEK